MVWVQSCTRIFSGTNTIPRPFVFHQALWSKSETLQETAMLDETTLRRLYLEEQRSIRVISQLKHVSTRSVYDALIHYRIPRRASGFRSPQVQRANATLDEPTLRRLYLDEERSIRNIAA